MAHTESNISGYVERIHTSLLLSGTPESVRIGLSSQEHNLAQIELQNLEIRRGLGRKVLHMEVIDLSGMPEHLNIPGLSQLKIHLGHTAIIGRGRLGLPVLELASVSENHVELSFSHTENGYQLGIHDQDSVNGSHRINPQLEPTWEERRDYFESVTPEETQPDPSEPERDYSFLYGPSNERYNRKPLR